MVGATWKTRGGHITQRAGGRVRKCEDRYLTGSLQLSEQYGIMATSVFDPGRIWSLKKEGAEGGFRWKPHMRKVREK